ncbi:MAG: acetoacetate decarboxylase family protein [Dehalococcoidia bacterium]
MPDQGRLSEAGVTHTTPVLAPLYAAPPWKLPGARVLRAIFETDKDAVLEWLPPKLTRSSPPYGLVSIEHYPESPIGPFSVAHQFIGCRAGFFVRAFALQSVVDNPIALTALREMWGFPCQPGLVRLSEDGASGRVEAGGEVLCEVALGNSEPLAPDLVRFDPILTLRLAPSLQEGVRHDLIQLMQIDAESEVHEATRGRGDVSYPEGSSWSVLPNRNPISAVSSAVDTELPLARYVMPY